nr:hypothetical protein [uncultured Mediterranean phage uvMED]
MSNITPLDALLSLGVTEIISNGIPTNAEEYATMISRSDGADITITWTQVVDKMTDLQAEYDAEEWKRNRQAEYPTHQDCIHALLDGGDTLTELQEKRQEIKAKYPKS